MPDDDTDPGTDRLVGLYRRYIGEPDDRTDVYLGFALFFGGLGLGLLGLLLFTVERGVLPGEEFLLREIAFAAGALGLPIVLASVVVLLPADRRAAYVAAAGLAVTVAAIVFFVAVYPSNWNYGSPDYSLQGVAVYAVGLVSVLAATGSALVGYHIERVRGGPDDAAGTGDGAGGEDPAVTRAQVERDIEDAMSSTEISWGGVEKVDTGRLTIRPDAELDGHNLDQVGTTVHRSSSVEDQLSALRGLQGGEQRTDSGSGVDDQASALKELRARKRQEAEVEREGLWARLKALVGL